jgi:ATP-grasp domain
MNVKPPALLVVGHDRAGSRPYIRASKRRDLNVVLVDGPEGRGAVDRGTWSGEPDYDEIAIAATSGPDAIKTTARKIAERWDVRAVVPGFDLFVETVPGVAHDLAIPQANAPEILARFRHKSNQRRLLEASELTLLQPRFAVSHADHHPDEVVRAARRIGYPCVLKAEDSGGSHGVLRVNSDAECLEKLARLRGLVRDDGLPSNGILLIEQLIGGPEYSLQGVVDGQGVVTLLSFCSINMDPGPEGDRFMSRKMVCRPASQIPGPWSVACQRIIGLFGLKSSPFHMDLRVTSDGAFKMIEAGARLSGANVTKLVQAATGIDWGDVALGLVLGEQPVIPPSLDRCAGQAILTTSGKRQTFGWRLALGGPLTESDEEVNLTAFLQEGPTAGYTRISDRAGWAIAIARTESRVGALLDTIEAALSTLGPVA